MHKVLDLFSGIGGFSLGLESTGGFETVGFCEIDPKARLVLNKHWPDIPVYENIKELTYERLKADGNLPTVITGGFPCQDISVAGKRKGIKAERSGLWSEMFRLIRDVRPTWAIIENVSALRSKGLTLVLQNLSSIGYMCEWHCIPASAVGAPHQRDRIWIVAHPASECTGPCIRETLSGWKDSEASDTEPCCGSKGGDTLFSKFGNEERPDNQMADTLCEHSAERGECANLEEQGNCGRDDSGGGKGNAERKRPIRVSGGGACDEVADSDSERCGGGNGTGCADGEWLIFQGEQERSTMGSEVEGCCTPHRESIKRLSEFWTVEPNVGRVAHGVPNRVDRLKQLGNSVVPQIPFLLGSAILNAESIQDRA